MLKYLLIFTACICLAQPENQSEFEQKFINIKTLSTDFIFDIKYATTDNFLKEKVYECGECYLLKSTAEALVAAQAEFKKKGYHIKIFDCYRPLSVQKKNVEHASRYALCG